MFHAIARRLAVAAAAVLAVSAPAAAADDDPPWDILVFGDSLVQGYGLSEGKPYPAQLQQALRAEGHEVRVTNAGSSGDTTEAGLNRLDWVLRERTDAVIVVLGANDALRGIDPAVTRRNMNKILKTLAEEDLPTLLAGMKAPRNMGKDYVERFDAVYPELAERYDPVFYPFFLEGVAQKPKLNQNDGIHPNAEGVRVIVENMRDSVEKLLARVKARAKES